MGVFGEPVEGFRYELYLVSGLDASGFSATEGLRGGRNEVTDFSDWVRLDLEYIDQWSLWLDFQILLRTIPAVLFGRGAR